MLYRVHIAWSGFELTTLVVIETDCIGSFKSNYHTITTTNFHLSHQISNKVSVASYDSFITHNIHV